MPSHNAMKVAWRLLTQPWKSKRAYRYTFFCIVSLSVLIQIWTWFPGLIGSDVFCQYLQAIGEINVTDWHPPIMARFWNLEISFLGTANLLDGTWIILAATGLSLFLYPSQNLLSLLIFLLVYFSPIFGAILGIMQKDYPLGYLLLIAAGIFNRQLFLKRALSREQKGLVLAILIVCILLRFNAVFAVAPLFVLLITSEWRPNFKYLGYALGVVFLFLFLSPIVNHNILGAGKDYPETSLELFDVAGIAHYKSHRVISEEDIFKKWDKASLSDKLGVCYYPKEFASFGGWSPAKHPILYPGYNKWSHNWISGEFLQTGRVDSRALSCIKLGAQLRQSPQDLQQLWFYGVKKHPLAYLRHRWKHFSEVYLFSPLAGSVAWGVGYYPQSELENPYQLRATWFLKRYQHFIWNHPNLLTNWGLFWIFIALFCFVISFRCQTYQMKLINVFSFASLMYALGYFWVGVGMDFRYIYPSIVLDVAALLTALLKVKELRSYDLD